MRVYISGLWTTPMERVCDCSFCRIWISYSLLDIYFVSFDKFSLYFSKQRALYMLYVQYYFWEGTTPMQASMGTWGQSLACIHVVQWRYACLRSSDARASVKYNVRGLAITVIVSVPADWCDDKVDLTSRQWSPSYKRPAIILQWMCHFWLTCCQSDAQRSCQRTNNQHCYCINQSNHTNYPNVPLVHKRRFRDRSLQRV